MARNKRATNEPFDGGQMDEFEGTDIIDSQKDMTELQQSHHASQSSDEVFFASGPFYAHLDDLDDDAETEDEELSNSIKNQTKSPFDGVDSNGRRSNTKCNVLYAEMPPHLSQSLQQANSRFASSNSKSIASHGTSSNGGKLKLKNLLMFGSNHKSATTSASPPIEQTTFDSFCCLIHQQQTHNSHQTDQCDSQQQGKSSNKQSQHRKTPFSPKMNTFNRILSSSQELFSHHKHKSASANISTPTNNSESSIRVIKPTAIRPQALPVTSDPSPYQDEHLQQCSRPATSADCYANHCAQKGSRKPLSAFHKVNSCSSSSKTSTNPKCSQHFRSNSLAESFVYPPPHRTQPLPPLPPQRSLGGQPSTSSTRPRSSDGRRRRNSRNGSEHVSFDQGSLDSIYSNDYKSKPTRTLIDSEQEPIHMTLEEVRRIAFGVSGSTGSALAECSSSSSSKPTCDNVIANDTQKQSHSSTNKHTKSKFKLAFENILHKTHCIGPNSPGSSSPSSTKNVYKVTSSNHDNYETSIPSFIPNGYRRINIEDQNPVAQDRNREPERSSIASPFIRRALPPLPRSDSEQHQPRQTLSAIDTSQDGETSSNNQSSSSVICQLRSQGYRSVLAGLGSKRTVPLSSMSPEERQRFLDYATSIERCGWYWGPVCGEMAEKLLETEPCGSFIVRDSSDEHYIFSLTFKLNGVVRHVRIEHDQGNFSFGSLQKYRSNTIVDFIESAVEHSRSGQFLFFLHRHSNGNLIEPVLPVRVQLLNPISRFRQVQSLQHNCRFTILKHVRRDQIHQLPLPDFLHTYLDTPYYYSEELANLQESIKREKLEGKKEEEKRRKRFMKTDPRTLVAKMLIDRVEIEKALNIVLPEQEVYGMPSEESTKEEMQELNDDQREEDEMNDSPIIIGDLEEEPEENFDFL